MTGRTNRNVDGGKAKSKQSRTDARQKIQKSTDKQKGPGKKGSSFLLRPSGPFWRQLPQK